MVQGGVQDVLKRGFTQSLDGEERRFDCTTGSLEVEDRGLNY